MEKKQHINLRREALLASNLDYVLRPAARPAAR